MQTIIRHWGGIGAVLAGLLIAGAPAMAVDLQEKRLSENDLTRYIRQYMKSQYPDREIERVYMLEKDGEPVGYRVEYTPDSGKTTYFHPDGRPMDAPPEGQASTEAK